MTLGIVRYSKHMLLHFTLICRVGNAQNLFMCTDSNVRFILFPTQSILVFICYCWINLTPTSVLVPLTSGYVVYMTLIRVLFQSPAGYLVHFYSKECFIVIICWSFWSITTIINILLQSSAGHFGPF